MDFDALADDYFDKQAAAREVAAGSLEPDTPTPEADADEAVREIDLDDLTPTEYEGVFLDPDGQPYQLGLDAAGDPVLEALEFEFEADDDDDEEIESYDELEVQLAQAFLEAADGDPEIAFDAFMRHRAKMGDREAAEVVNILDEVVSEQLEEEVSEAEIEDWFDSNDVDPDVGAELIIKAAQLVEAGDADPDSLFDVATELLEQTRGQELDVLRELENTRAAGVRDWKDGLSAAYDGWASGDTERHRAAPTTVSTSSGPQSLGSQRRMGDELGTALDGFLEREDVKSRTKRAVQARLLRGGELT